MWFDDFSNKLFETIQSCGTKATDLKETDQVNWSKVQDRGIYNLDFNCIPGETFIRVIIQ